MNTLRKAAEIEFHDKLREDAPHQRWTVENERSVASNPLWSNFKFYAVERTSLEYVEHLLKTRCPGARVLDYCCGSGDDTIKLARLGASEAVGIDISDVGLEHGRLRATAEGLSSRVHFHRMDAENLDFEDEHFDLIKVYGCLHHLDLDRAYSELARVLKRDGMIVCTEALGGNPFIQLYRRLTPNLRTPWEIAHLMNRRRLKRAEAFFSDVRPRFFHLATLLAVPVRRLEFLEPALTLLEWADSVLLKLPLLRWQAWQVVFTLSNPRSASALLPNFSSVTETPLTRASDDQLRILYTRYDLASKYSSGKDVLEVACGAGMGLGLLASVARRTVGGDIDERNLKIAKQTYAGRGDIELKYIDAQSFPFADKSFDVVILYEALYYLPSTDSFFREARRVLRSGGTLLISTVNCRWGGFNPSPLSVKYLDAAQLAEILVGYGFQVEMRGGFPESAGGWLHPIVRLVRKVAVRLHLFPKTMKGKEWLKRLFYGELKPIPAQLSPGSATTPAPLTSLREPYSCDQYRFIYAIGSLP